MARKENWIMMKKAKNKKVKFVAVSQILSLILEIFAFSFIIGGMAVGVSTIAAVSIPIASAAGINDIIQKGCCLEARDGSVCQDLNTLDAANCKTSLIPTTCKAVDNCLVGCCYNPNGGDCSLNAPKEQCEQTGGNWSSDALCNIQECQLGCCVLGDQSSITTSRECTKLSRDLNFERKFEGLDEDGTCNTKSGLEAKGACVTTTGDFSGENNCKFGTKEDCQRIGGVFNENYLCTAEALKTICKPSKQTTCVEGKDQVYYLDDCGNIANIYDANKFSDQSYWDIIIEPADSCSSANKDCGNCDYTTGSVCNSYRLGKDTKPTFGNNVCRNLNCANGRKHGESWCISDYNTAVSAAAPVGSRSFVGKCLDGEISIEPCADFNQEICISNTGTSGNGNGFSEAKCIANDWRSCLAANQKTTYADVSRECGKYEQCSMILDIEGNKKYAGLPGFNKDIPFEWQGAALAFGKGTNKNVVWCVPKYTPGLVFWQDAKTLTNADLFPQTGTATETQNQQQTQTSATANSGMSSGGGFAETQAICSMGSFTCVSHKQRQCELAGDSLSQTLPGICVLTALNPNSARCDLWLDKENWECNIDGVTKTIASEQLPKVLEAYNERCRSVGSCGSYINVAGQVGSNEFNSAIKRTKIDAKGKTKDNYNKDAYVLSKSYLSSFSGKAGLIPAGSITSLTAAVVLGITGRIGEETLASPIDFGLAARGSIVPATPASTAFTPTYYATGGTPAPIQGPGFGTAFFATISAGLAAQQIAGMIAENQDWSPGKASTWIMAVTSTVANSVAAGFAVWGIAACSTIIGCIAGIVSLIIALFMIVYTNCIDNEYDESEYYTLQYTCEPWSPPQKGDCNVCNTDIRACSENRCKSLGLNCEYYNDKGEPGYCAAIDDTWSAKITPWPEALTEGNQYADVTGMKFSIKGNSEDGKVMPWQNLEFGIITDKPATCKIDNKHTANFEEMAVDMIKEVPAYSSQEAQGNILGMYHKVALSSYIGQSESGESTLSLATGQENNYYIRCENFAGQGNEAEFAVKVIVSDAPDLTPPYIKGFSPISGSYLGLGSNSTSVFLYVDEPAECRYSIGVNNNFEQMTGKMSCLTSASNSVLGKWPCYTTLANLTVDKNDFYFACKDKPDSIERTVAEKRITNENPMKYTLNVCSKGLDITSISPIGKVISGKSPVALTIEAETAGCIDNGVSTCYYEFASGGGRIEFSQTGSTKHKQIFDSLSAGEHNITIYCEDEAGNNDATSIIVNVELDNSAPKVLKAFQSAENLVIVTNENSECKYTTNSTLGCSFNYDTDKSETMTGATTYHYGTWSKNTDYYVKCKDGFGNQNFDCGIKLRTY